MNGLNWNHLRTFVAVVEEGSLSAGAAVLDLSQPTAGRHVAELESTLGFSLFERHPRGLAITERGSHVYERAVVVRRSVDALERQVAGLEEELAGTVRVSCSEVVGCYVLPALLSTLQEAHPELDLEVVADDRPSSLLRRDADIAVRMFRPEQEDLIAQKLGEAALGLYASQTYLQRRGTPEDLDALSEHVLIGGDRGRLHLEALATLGLQLQREDFALRCDAPAFHLEAARSGLGITALQHQIAAARPGLVQVLPECFSYQLPVWLVAHPDLRQSRRVRVAYDFLAEQLGRHYADESATR